MRNQPNLNGEALDTIDKLELALNDNGLTRQQALQKVCACVQELIPNANLVSLWRFNEDQSAIISLVNFDATSSSFTSNIVLDKSSFPVYFQNIVENELIVASEAREHPATSCFNEAYFEPNNIHSLLDFILHKNYRPVGVICCESKGGLVQWTTDDIENIRMVAALISFFFDV